MRIKRYLSLFLVVLVSVFALGLANKDVKANEEFVINIDSKYTTSYNQNISNGVIDGHLIQSVENVLSVSYVTGRVDTIFNNGSGEIRLYNGSLVISVIDPSKYLISKISVQGSGSNLKIDNISNSEVNFSPYTNTTTIKHDSNKDNYAISEINITVVEVISDLTATVNQLFGPGNKNLIPDISAEYGQDVVVPVTKSGDNVFQFALVNGVIRNDFVLGDNTLPITEGLDVSLVYATEETHAVLFLDSNGKVLSNTWVADGGNVTAPETVNLSKPGYKLSETPWLSNGGDSSLENITSSRVYRLQYELEETSKINITVGETTSEYNFNDVVTLTATNPNFFKAWVDEEGNVLSTKETFKFTALVDRTINESTVATLPTTPIITMTNDLELREGMQSFLGQLELRETDTLVEYGLVASEDVLLSQEQLTLDNADKLSSKVLVPATNEFMLSIPNNYVVVRAFVTVRNTNNEIETLYSDNQFDNVVVLTFNTDGGTEIDPLLVKKGTIATKPTNPTKGTNVFVGWFVEEVEFDFTQTITQDLEITAKWELPTIDKVREFNSGTSVEFLGIVTRIDNRNLFVQDETAAIYLYNANLPTGLEVGDMVRVEGSRSAYQGLEQIGSGATVTILSSDNELPIFETTNLSGIDSTQQSRLIAVSGLTVKEQSGNNLTLTDGTNDILLYAQTGTEVYDYIQGVIQGQTVNIYQGFIGWYNNNIQLEVGEATHIEIVPLTDADYAQIVLDEIIKEWSDKEFKMGTSVALPLQGDHDSTIVWEFDPENAVVDGKWNEVLEDTTYRVIVIVTLGDVELDDIFEITVKFVDDIVIPKEVLDSGTFTGKNNLPTGWTHIGLGSDYSDPNTKLKFDTTGDTLKTPTFGLLTDATVSIYVRNNGISGSSKLEVLDQNNNVIHTFNLSDLPTQNNNGTLTFTITNLNITQLTLKYTKRSGNLGVGSVKVEHIIVPN